MMRSTAFMDADYDGMNTRTNGVVPATRHAHQEGSRTGRDAQGHDIPPRGGRWHPLPASRSPLYPFRRLVDGKSFRFWWVSPVVEKTAVNNGSAQLTQRETRHHPRGRHIRTNLGATSASKMESFGQHANQIIVARHKCHVAPHALAPIDSP
ncbi:hypothetical protein GW17_00003995 [Ensete ventricosum]|nr:hypothetical protein GW17_00003995 [Ensete ventricosum]